MPDAPDPDRLRALEDRLRQAKGADAPHSAIGEAHSQGQLAWRMVTELVAGLLIGFGIGYGLDTLLGTLPWMMLIFTVLGLVAGVRVMIRSAREVEQKMQAGDDPQGEGHAGTGPQGEGDDTDGQRSEHRD